MISLSWIMAMLKINCTMSENTPGTAAGSVAWRRTLPFVSEVRVASKLSAVWEGNK